MKKLKFVLLLTPIMFFQGCESKEKSATTVPPAVDDSIVSASFSPDGKKVLVAHKNYVLLYDAASGAVIKKYPVKTKKEEFIEKLFSDVSADNKDGGK